MGTDAEIIKDDVKEAHILQQQLMGLLKKGTSGGGNKSRRKSKTQRGGNALKNAKDLSTIATSLIMVYREKPPESLNSFIEKYGSDGLKTRIISAGKDAEMFLKTQKGGQSGSGSGSRSRSRSGSGSRSRSGSRSENDSFDESEEIQNENKNVYTGEKNEKGEKHGTGKMEYANGDVYDGQWKGNLRHGNGKITFLNKSRYEGTWSKDQITGKGIYTYFNGDVYEGTLENAIRTGFGKMTFQNGDVYEGSWKKNRREGEGKLHYKNGDNFVGHWRKDMRDGEGRLTDAIGKVLEEGEYEDDEPPFDIAKVDTFIGDTSAKINKVLNSENFVKMKGMLSKFNENMPDVTSTVKYSLYFSHIISAVWMLYSTGGKWCPDGGAQPLICVTVQTVYNSIQGNASFVLTGILNSIQQNINLAATSGIAYWNATLSTIGWFQPIFFGIAATGFASFLLLILYGTWVYINTPREDHEKLNKTRRRHK